MKTEKIYTILTAALAVKRTPQYVRKAIKDGKLIGHLVLMEGRADANRYEITQSNLNAWRKGIGKRRADGRTKYVLYATAEEIAKLPPELTAHLTKAYDPAKAKARKAAKLAPVATSE